MSSRADKFDPARAPVNFLSTRFKTKSANTELDRALPRENVAQRTRWRDQFLHCEGLREVIVRTWSKAGHSIAHLHLVRSR